MKLTTGTRHVGCAAGSRWPWRASLSRRRSRRARRPDSWRSRPDWRAEVARRVRGATLAGGPTELRVVRFEEHTEFFLRPKT